MMTDAALTYRAGSQPAVRALTARSVLRTDRLLGSSDELQIAVLRGFEAFSALEDEWNALFERAGVATQVFQQFNWLWHCHQHYGRGPRDPQIVLATARLDDRLILVWPLQLSCRRGLCELAWFGDPVGQYGDVLVDDLGADLKAAALALTWSAICEAVHPDLVQLRRVREDSHVGPFLKSIDMHVVEQCCAPALDLSTANSFETFCSEHQTRHLRKERRRHSRRFAELGDVVYERVETPREAAEVAREAVHLKRAWLATKSLASKTLADDRVLSFFAEVARGETRSVGCEVHAVRCDGELAGAQIGFLCKGRLLLHVIVYNVKFQRAGVGALQLSQIISECFDRDLHAVDLLAPKADYKMEWANQTVAVTDYVYAPTTKGRFLMSAYIKRIRPALKSLVPWLPKRVRQLASI